MDSDVRSLRTYKNQATEAGSVIKYERLLSLAGLVRCKTKLSGSANSKINLHFYERHKISNFANSLLSVVGSWHFLFITNATKTTQFLQRLLIWWYCPAIFSRDKQNAITHFLNGDKCCGICNMILAHLFHLVDLKSCWLSQAGYPDYFFLNKLGLRNTWHCTNIVRVYTCDTLCLSIKQLTLD